MTPAIKSVLVNSLCRAAALLYVSALITIVWFIVYEIKLLRKENGHSHERPEGAYGRNSLLENHKHYNN